MPSTTSGRTPKKPPRRFGPPLPPESMDGWYSHLGAKPGELIIHEGQRFKVIRMSLDASTQEPLLVTLCLDARDLPPALFYKDKIKEVRSMTVEEQVDDYFWENRL